MLNNHAKLIRFFSEANGITGRKKLQKMIYILQKCDIPFEEKYQFHFYIGNKKKNTIYPTMMLLIANNIAFINKSNRYQNILITRWQKNLKRKKTW